MQAPENKSIEKLVEMVKDIRSCMLITNPVKAGSLSGRPMGVNTVDEDGSMWFFTKKSSNKADEIEADSKVSLAIVDDSDGIYLMINGTANLSQDKAKMEELWNPYVKAWFPDGLEDPELMLIKVIPTDANYWDSSSNTMVEIYHTLKAIVTGTVSNEGEYGKINI
jgi:general stress protein 26